MTTTPAGQRSRCQPSGRRRALSSTSADALLFYAAQVARRAQHRLPVLRDGRPAPAWEQVDNAVTAAHVLEGLLHELGSGRAWHPSGLADASGWAGMAVTEILVHGHDAAAALGVELALPGQVCARTVARVFPWFRSVWPSRSSSCWPSLAVHASPSCPPIRSGGGSPRHCPSGTADRVDGAATRLGLKPITLPNHVQARSAAASASCQACSLCGKPNTKVGKLVAGPTVFICDGLHRPGFTSRRWQPYLGSPSGFRASTTPPFSRYSSSSLRWRRRDAGTQAEHNLRCWITKARSLGAT